MNVKRTTSQNPPGNYLVNSYKIPIPKAHKPIPKFPNNIIDLLFVFAKQVIAYIAAIN
jgi:hypothetical protein